ncbi:MAG: FAD-dependent oxidoreductase [Candidatus Poseidonia sp.]|nr:FAD-dependent oxidoreductase [Poseidonia sp.]
MNRVKVAVVGAGIAGLAVAVGCERAGHSVTVFESKSHVGGRMETVKVDGHPVDVGFHVLHTAYPTVQRWLDVPALQAKPMENCTVTIHPTTGRRRLLGDALRAPRYLPSTLKSVGVGDGLRFLKWRLGTKASDLERALDLPSPSIAAGLQQRRFRPSTRRVLGPLFAGITLDPTLSERFAFADFTWGAMAHGQMVVPKDGIVAVPRQLAARLTRADVRLNAPVSAVTSQTVTTETGSESFDRVVLAVPQHIASALLPSLKGQHTPVERLTSTVVFRAPRAPFKQARLLLNEEWGEPRRRVLHVHVPTNLHPHPGDEHWVVATLVGEHAADPDEAMVLDELVDWFGPEVRQWHHLATTTVRHALPHIDPEHHERRLPDLTIDDVLVVGDHRAHPSVQGALASAERALEQLGVPIPREVLA